MGTGREMRQTANQNAETTADLQQISATRHASALNLLSIGEKITHNPQLVAMPPVVFVAVCIYL